MTTPPQANIKELKMLESNFSGKTQCDISYRKVDDLFTAFYPNTSDGEDAWKKIAEKTDGTGKVFSIHAEDTIMQLKEAGYTVEREVSEDIDVDSLMADLLATA